MPSLPPRASPPPRAPAISPHASVAVPQQLQSSSRPLLPLQPRLQLTPAHLSAAIAVVASQAVTTPSPRPTMASATNSKKPLKPKAPSRARLVLPSPLLAAASAAALALVTGDDDASTTSPTHSAASSSTATARRSLSASKSDDKERVSRAMKKCSVMYCESLARSRGLCKAHGGGKRCKRPGCEVSDQGGGFCIRHGGGKRCLIEGCDKSAQSRHYCKAHGGGARCVVDGCEKSSQGGGLCRAHGGGPRRKRVVDKGGEIITSPRSTKRTKYRAELAARALVSAAQTIMAQEEEAEDEERIECEPGSSALSFTIRCPVEADTRQGVVAVAEGDSKDDEKTKEKEDAANGPTRQDGDAEGDGKDHDDTHLFVAASLLGMQTASAE